VREDNQKWNQINTFPYISKEEQLSNWHVVTPPPEEPDTALMFLIFRDIL
jgi:hypothetical protein